MYAVLSTVLLLPAVVSAQYKVGNAPKGMAKQADANSLLTQVINWLLGILASLSILMIVVAGIMYITSAGDEGKVESAKKWLIYAVVGLVVALLGFVIVSTVSGALGAG